MKTISLLFFALSSLSLTSCSIDRKRDDLAGYEIRNAILYASNKVQNGNVFKDIPSKNIKNEYSVDWSANFNKNGNVTIVIQFAKNGSSLITDSGQISAAMGGYPDYFSVSVEIFDQNLNLMRIVDAYGRKL
jgi:TRAP-type C4-dicarboxylate transport system substrate-binding protein